MSSLFLVFLTLHDEPFPRRFVNRAAAAEAPAVFSGAAGRLSGFPIHLPLDIGAKWVSYGFTASEKSEKRCLKPRKRSLFISPDSCYNADSMIRGESENHRDLNNLEWGT